VEAACQPRRGSETGQSRYSWVCSRRPACRLGNWRSSKDRKFNPTRRQRIRLSRTVVIAVMAVTFLGQIMSWNGETHLLDIGVPVALVIAALNIYVWITKAGKQ